MVSKGVGQLGRVEGRGFVRMWSCLRLSCCGRGVREVVLVGFWGRVSAFVWGSGCGSLRSAIVSWDLALLQAI